MKRGVLFMAVVVALVSVVGVGSAYAQNTAVVNIPFKFTFNNRDLAPGKYNVTVSNDGLVTLTAATTGEGVLGPAITRLGQHQTPIDVPTFIFDSLNQRYYLSEVWLPMEDGYLLTDTRQPHQHHTIKGSKKG